MQDIRMHKYILPIMKHEIMLFKQEWSLFSTETFSCIMINKNHKNSKQQAQK
jgi:hypothetical protein